MNVGSQIEGLGPDFLAGMAKGGFLLFCYSRQYNNKDP